MWAPSAYRGAVPDFTVVRVGTDPSDRPIYMTIYMREWWTKQVLAHPKIKPFAHQVTIVQGAFMSRIKGGGAEASSGYHDEGGCIDIRVWNLTDQEIATLISVVRWLGATIWLRNQEHGRMDEHLHLLLGSDRPLASGAAWQWSEYLIGHDGLATRGPDYHPRPSPLVTVPPTIEQEEVEEDVVTPEDIKDIAQAAAEAVVNYDISIVGTDEKQNLSTHLSQVNARALQARDGIRVLQAQVKALASALDALSAAMPPEVTKAVIAALADTIDIDVDINVSQP